MKQALPTRLAYLLLACLLLACNRHGVEPDGYYLVYPEYRPVLIARAALEAAATALPPQAMHNTGKLYLWGDYVLVNEKYQGIHVIDNHDPAHPRPISFLRLPGNLDLAMRGNILYADSGPDLVAFDLSNPAAAQPVGRTRDAFPELPMPVAGYLEDACLPANRPAATVVIGWRKLAAGEAVPVKVSTYRNNGAGPIALYSTTSTSVAPSATGKGGSLARFAVAGNTLYVVDDQSLRVFGLQNPVQPTTGPVVRVGIGIETIFPQGSYLFLGSQTGMFVYDATLPAAPRWVSTISHARSCDPVVVDGRFAYVTLRSTTPAATGGTATTVAPTACSSTQTNQLDVIDLATISRPQLVRTYPLSGPQGLGVENNRLYVCDDVLRVFDTAQAPVLTPVQQVAVALTDVIPNGQYLLGVGPGGLYQFALGATMQQVSVLPITPGS